MEKQRERVIPEQVMMSRWPPEKQLPFSLCLFSPSLYISCQAAVYVHSLSHRRACARRSDTLQTPPPLFVCEVTWRPGVVWCPTGRSFRSRSFRTIKPPTPTLTLRHHLPSVTLAALKAFPSPPLYLFSLLTTPLGNSQSRHVRSATAAT